MDSTDYTNVWNVYSEYIESLAVGNVDENRCNCPNGDDHYDDVSNGQVVCQGCGFVIKASYIDCGAEWRNYQDGSGKIKDSSRCGFPIDSTYKSSLSTVIAGNSRLAKMSKWGMMTYEELSRYKLTTMLRQKIGDKLPPMMIKDVMHLFITSFSINSDTRNKEIHRGKIRDGLIAVCLFEACKQNNIIRSIFEVSEIMDIDVKVFNKANKIYSESLNASSGNIIESSDLVTRFCAKMNLDKKLSKLAKLIIYEITSNGYLRGITPQGIIGGVIYFIHDEMNKLIDTDIIATACEVKPMTCVKTSAKIREHKTSIFEAVRDRLKK